MTVSKVNKKTRNIILWAAFVLVVLTGVSLRLIEIESDPPMYFDGHSQSLSTDPYQYTHFARNKILFDQWEIFDSAKWRTFEYSLVSGFSYLVFSIFGISRTTANISGLALSLLSIFIFLFGIRKLAGLVGLLIAAVFLMFNKTFLVYGRLPYLENGMIFIIVLVFLVFIYFREQTWGQILLGILIALAALTGKIFGFIIIVPVIVTILYENKNQQIKSILIVIISCIITSLVWIVSFHGGSIGEFINYYSSQTIDLYGIPDAVKSPVLFFERLISFGAESRFYYHAPALGLAGFLSLVSILFTSGNGKRMNGIIIFFIVWFASCLLFFMISNYRPLRYHYMLYLPLAGLAAYMLSSDFKNSKLSLEKNVKQFIVLFFLIWIFSFQIITNLFYLDLFESSYRIIIWITCGFALMVVLLEIRIDLLKRVLLRKHFKIIIFLLALLSVLNFAWSYTVWNRQISYGSKEAGEDIDQILNVNAVISGPMAPTVLLENNAKAVFYAVGISDKNPEFFKEQPITHFIIDAEISGVVTTIYPQLKQAEPVAEYWIRDSKIVLVRINQLTGNKEASDYLPTDYEIGKSFLNRNILDSAFYYLERFHNYHPENKSCLKTLGELYMLGGKVEQGNELLKKAVSLYPQDFSLHFLLGGYYQQIAMATGENSYKRLAIQSYEKAQQINPYQWDEIENMINKIAGRN